MTFSLSTLHLARGTKRKFDFDTKEVDAIAQEAEEAALKQIEAEQAESRRAKLPDFWLPSLTPEALPTRLKDVKLQTLCHASSPAHTIRQAF
jgi:nitric oxide synthase-interacting protein